METATNDELAELCKQRFSGEQLRHIAACADARTHYPAPSVRPADSLTEWIFRIPDWVRICRDRVGLDVDIVGRQLFTALSASVAASVAAIEVHRHTGWWPTEMPS